MFTPAEFKTFCAVKPTDEVYDYGNPCSCALEQFLSGKFPEKNVSVGSSFYAFEDSHEVFPIPPQIDEAVLSYPRTFGALTERLDAI